MDSFPVICETCRARLKVRDPGIIGQIHACPKCGSMVLITPPAGWSAGQTEAPSSPEIAKSVAAPPGTATPQPTTTVHEVNVTTEMPELDTLLGQVAGVANEPVPAAAPAVEPAAPPPPPTDSLASRWIVVAAGGASLLVVGGLLVAMWSRGGASRTEAPPAAASATVAAAAPATPPDDARASSTTAEHEERSATTTADAKPPAVAVAEPAAAPQPAEPTSPPALPPAQDIAAADAEPGGSASAAARHAASSPTGDGVPAASEPISTPPEPHTATASGPLRFDPLDFDPTQLSLSSSGVVEMVPPPEEQSEDAGDGPGELPMETADDKADEVGAAEAPEVVSPPSPTAVVRLGPGSSEATRRRDVAGQLALEIDAIDLPQVPLTHVLEMISGLADVPIALDPAALEMTGISPAFPVTLRAEKISMADLLSQSLAQCRLSYEARDGVIVVTKADVDRERSVNFRVDDLVPAGADAAPMARLIERLVAPDSWQAAGRLAAASGNGTIDVDGDTLHVRQANRVLYQLLTFCERLRLARGLATRSRYPVGRLHVEPAYPQLAKRLSARTTFTFLPWTPLADVFRYWHEAAGVTVLVDWQALATAELAPSTPVACTVTDRPWMGAMDAVLTPLGLAWRAVDGETIQITTSEAAARTPQIEFYPVPKRLLSRYASPDALVAALVDEARTPADGGAAAGDAAVISFDVPSERLIVRAPAPLQRYLSGRLAGE